MPHGANLSNHKKRLIIYNLETNLDSPVLAAAHDWIYSFAGKVSETVVYSTHVGRYSLPSNVVVYEIGGGSLIKRTRAIFRLFLSFLREFAQRKETLVFHHMSTYSLLIVGPLYKLIKVPQGLWFSHAKGSWSLKLSHFNANLIFSSTPSTIPISGKKLRFTGHGIESSKFLAAFKTSNSTRKGIVCLGRIAPIKNLEGIIEALSNTEFKSSEITFIGQTETNTKYMRKLEELARKKGAKIIFKPSVSYHSLPAILCEFDAIYTGTPKSVDKAVIEGAICGCFVISTSESALKLTGMDQVFRYLGFSTTPTLAEQIISIERLSEDERLVLRNMLSAQSVKINDLSSTASKILADLGFKS